MVGSRDERISGLIAVGVTVDIADFSFLNDYEKPKLIIQGNQDQYGQVKTLQDWFQKLQEPKKMDVIDGAVHLFDGKLTELKNAIIQDFPTLMETGVAAAVQPTE
jgi:alpha/beta superfamily hydrolase